ncbi:diacylglycerol kinase family protein [Sanguibacter sp. HDW7]|uniref:diacylglycerol/lipid kinase family protein n=1 Tax=Sanguibacter sp. HDW7 TaxID=2714931 RepID=UPI001F102C0C|nr:diacylglycerol kinase family protein [Sanguibacter sp. HDW7]
MGGMSGWEIFWIVLAVGLAAGAFALSLLTWRSRHLAHRPHLAVTSPPVPDAPRRLVAFVANPSKPDVAQLRAPVEKACRSLGLEPLWLETTVEDPGSGQARAALEAGAEVVVAAGGDGTVRAVATTLQGTGVPMGLLPVGTGNLLARNLDIPVTDLARSLEIALEGRDRAIDVAWLRVTDAPAGDDAAEVGSEHIFLVIAGIGFDAAMIADTDTTLKAKVGWIAYFLGGIRHLHGRRLEARVLLDDTRRSSMKLRTLLVGNCGRLPGGITLLPDALLDDGILDVAAIDTRAGVAGWAQLFGEVVMQGLGVQPLATNRIGRIDHTQCRSIAVRVPDGAQAQVDGDPVGRATAIECRVDHADLLVRVPRALTL